MSKYSALLLAVPVLLCACSVSPDRGAEPAASAYSSSTLPARQLMQDGRMQEAIPLLRALSQEYPELASPCINLSIAYRDSGDSDLARKAVEEALRRAPDNVSARHQSAILYREAGDFALAEKDYLKALDTEPDYALAHRNLGILYDLYMQRPDRALPHYQRYLQLDPEQSREVSLWVSDIELRLPAAQAKAAP